MTDLLDSIQRQLRQRLDELRPFVVEYERLQAAAAALDGGAAERPVKRHTGGGRRRSAGRRSSSPTSRTVNRERVLATIGERPGVSKAELKEAAGLTSAGVAQNLRRLLDRGEIREEPLPSGQAGYRLAEPGGA